MTDALDLPARHENVAGLPLGPAPLDRALDLVASGPDRSVWAGAIDAILLVAGAILVLSGIVCFFAWNWADLHRFAKLGIVAAGIAGAGLAALRLGLERLAGQVALSAAAVLVGVLLAVYGQIYQTGADAWELFRGWAALSVPLVLAACFPPLWAFWMLVVDVALGTFVAAEQMGAEPAAWLFFAINAAAWIAWEALEGRVAWMRGRGVPRLLSLPTLGALLVPAVLWAIGEGNGTGRSALALAAACAAAAYLFSRFRKDLFVVAVALAASITFVTSLAGDRMLDHAEALLLLGLLLVAQLGGAVRWLVHLHRSPG